MFLTQEAENKDDDTKVVLFGIFYPKRLLTN